MKQKKIVAGVLILVMASLCVLMIISGLAFLRSGYVPFIFSLGIQSNLSTAVATIEEHESIPVVSPARLIIENPFGNVKMTGYSGDQITIDIVKRAWGMNPEKAREYLEKTRVEISREEKLVTVNVIPAESTVGIAINVDLIISIPIDTAIKTTLKNGDIGLDHLEAEAILHSDFGDIHVSDLENGELNATSRNGEVTAVQIKSNGFPIALGSDFGDMQLLESNGSQIDIQSKNGAITLSNVKSSGPVTLASDFGSISFIEGRTGAFEAFSRNGDVKISSTAIGGSLTIQTDFGDINLDKAVARSYDLQNKNGTIRVDTASGPVVINTDFGDIEILNGQLCDLNLETQNGDINYKGSLGAGPHYLTAKFGDISLGLPPDSTINLDAQTAFGDINNEFDITTSGKVQDNHLTGTINNGGAVVNLNTSNGTITLNAIHEKES